MKLTYSIAVVVFILLVTSGESARGQKRLSRPTDQPQTRQATEKDSLRGLRENVIKASEEYKATLKELMSNYEANLKRVTERYATWNELFNSGVISRREYETSVAEITEARVKVDELRKQIATVDVTIAEASRRPQPDLPRTSEAVSLSPVAASWTTGNSKIDGLIRENGAHFGVNPYFIYCVMQQESVFNPTALSIKGAQGLMQLMPDTAARYGVVDASDPAQNIRGGARYLKDLIQLFNGRIDLVLAGYNAGEGAVIRYGRTIPPYKETQDYVRLISRRCLQKVKLSFQASDRN
jgi:Transglycosylase SLT domain